MSNGCGCERGLLRYVKPPLAKMFYVACCLHDDAYDIGGTSANRKAADVQLYRDMCKIIERKRQQPWRAFCCTFVALMYYASVRVFGRFYFNHTNNQTKC